MKIREVDIDAIEESGRGRAMPNLQMRICHSSKIEFSANFFVVVNLDISDDDRLPDCGHSVASSRYGSSDRERSS